MNMKMGFVVLVFVFLFAVNLASAETADSSSIKIDGIKYNPTPAKAGDYLDLFITNTSKGGGLLRSVYYI